MSNANSVRLGNVIEYKNGLYKVLKLDHTQPGKGGAFVQMELKEITTGTKLNERFRSTVNVDVAFLEETKYQYLFDDGNLVTLMDMETYEQIEVAMSLFGGQAVYLQENMEVVIEDHDGTPIGGKVQKQIDLEVSETEPVVKGQTAASSNKPAILSNGIRVMVPPFVNVGDIIVVRTEDNQYIERRK